MDERQKMMLRKQEDLLFTQGCIWAVFILIVELLLFQIRDHYINFTTAEESLSRAEFILSAITWGRVGSAALMVVGLFWLAISLGKEKTSLFPPTILFSASFVLFAVCHGTMVYHDGGVELLLLLVPAWGGLGLVYFLYQIEFFISALFTSLGGIGLWLYRQTSLYDGDAEMSMKQMTFYIFINTALLLIIAGFLLVNKASKTKGTLVLKHKNITLISDTKDNSSLWLVGLSGVISFLAIAISMGLNSPSIATYCSFALLAWLFILLVYFTVKLM